MRIVQAIVKDQRSVLTVSTLLDNYLGISDVCLGIPVVVSRSGIERVVELELSEDEYVKLNESANVLKAMQREIGY